MKYISGFGLENFKVFKDKVHFDFAPLTILTGTNNSGKSTVINALRLLKENFKDYKIKDNLYENIDNILKTDFDVNIFSKRYGNLAQFISRQGKKSWFSFSFTGNMVGIDDEMEVVCKIRVNNNALKNGNISELIVNSIKTKTRIIHIQEHKENKNRKIANDPALKKHLRDLYGEKEVTWRMEEGLRDYINNFGTIEKNESIELSYYSIKLDLYYFYQQYAYSIDRNIDYEKDFVELKNLEKRCNAGELSWEDYKQSVLEFNKKHNCVIHIPDDSTVAFQLSKANRGINLVGKPPRFIMPTGTYGSEAIDQLEKLEKELEEVGIYDFSFLWKKNNAIKQELESLLTQFYKGKSIKAAWAIFQKDVLKFLSDIEWKRNPISFSEPDDMMTKYIFNDFERRQFDTQRNNKLYQQAFSLDRFLNSFTNITTYLINDTAHYAREKPERLHVDENDISHAIKKNHKFYSGIFKAFLQLCFQSLEFEKEYNPSFAEEGEESDYVFYSHFPTERRITNAEGNIYELIEKNIMAVPNRFNNLKQVKFLLTNHNVPQRIYSLGDNTEFSNLIKSIYSIDEKYRMSIFNFIDRCINIFGIGDGLEIESIRDTSEFKIYIKKDGYKTLLADMGYGSLQVLPIILRLIPDFNRPLNSWLDRVVGVQIPTVIIEEPETNLHPALQSKLADIFVEAIRYFEIRLVIETHSEYLIRKLQYLTAKYEIQPEFTHIYYCYHPDKVPPGEKQVVKIDIRQDGSLSNDFGTGFFDEADKIAMSVWSLNQSRKN